MEPAATTLGRWMIAVVVLLAGTASLLHAAAEGVEPLVTVREGTLPVILSAPHGGRTPIPGVPPREGRGVKQFETARDDNTAELTEQVADAIERETGRRPYVVIAHFERKFVDANRPAADAYEHAGAKVHYDAYHAALRAAAADVKAKWGRGLLVDIHGQKTTANAIYRGTRDGKSVTDLIQRAGVAAVTGPASVVGHLAGAGYAALPVAAGDTLGKETRFNGGYITDTYGSHRRTAIDVIQLELGSDLRKAPRLAPVAADLGRAVKAFAGAYLPKASVE